MSKVPERLNDFKVYRSGTNDLMGVVDITLPSFTQLSETVSGAGILGEYESPTIGQFQSMKLTLNNWRTITEGQIKLLRQEAHRLDCRGGFQVYDSASGKYSITPVRLVVQGPPMNTELGSMAKNSQSNGTNEIEVIYLKLQINGRTMVEIDKVNYVCIIDGVDYSKELRSALGM